jgi:hypothetical protein
MFDNLREMTNESYGIEESDESPFETADYRAPERRIFGMTTGQRLVLSILILATVVVMGLSCLMITEKVWLF